MKKNWLKHIIFLGSVGICAYLQHEFYIMLVKEDHRLYGKSLIPEYDFGYWLVLVFIILFLFLGIYGKTVEESSFSSSSSFGTNKDDGYVHPSDGSHHSDTSD